MTDSDAIPLVAECFICTKTFSEIGGWDLLVLKFEVITSTQSPATPIGLEILAFTLISTAIYVRRRRG